MAVRIQDGTGNALTSTSSALDVNIKSSSGSQTVSGTVSVGNFPATQPVSGTVSVSNLPATQPVSGAVSVSNFPATQPVSGTVTVGNASIPVTGTFFQATQPVSIAASVTVAQATGTNLRTVVDSGTVTAAPTSVAAGAYTAKFINASGAAVSVKASAGNLYGFSITNETAAVAYIEFFNIASAPTLGTTAVVFAVKLPASANITLSPAAIALMNFSTGIGFAVTTTENGTTTASVTGMIFYQ